MSIDTDTILAHSQSEEATWRVPTQEERALNFLFQEDPDEQFDTLRERDASVSQNTWLDRFSNWLSGN
jgi:hypothetical protein